MVCFNGTTIEEVNNFLVSILDVNDFSSTNAISLHNFSSTSIGCTVSPILQKFWTTDTGATMTTDTGEEFEFVI